MSPPSALVAYVATGCSERNQPDKRRILREARPVKSDGETVTSR